METLSIPDDTIVRAAVERGEPILLAGIRIDRRRRRGVKMGAAVLAGVALFASGIAVGGAALNPFGPGAADFTIECHTHGLYSYDAYAMPHTSGERAREAAAKADPAGHCRSVEQQLNVENHVSGEIRKLVDSGTDNGTIRITDGGWIEFHRNLAQDGDSDFWWSYSPTSPPGAPHPTATLSIPRVQFGPAALCRISDTKVAVYPRGSGTAAATCAGLGHSIWGG